MKSFLEFLFKLFFQFSENYLRSQKIKKITKKVKKHFFWVFFKNQNFRVKSKKNYFFFKVFPSIFEIQNSEFELQMKSKIWKKIEFSEKKFLSFFQKSKFQKKIEKLKKNVFQFLWGSEFRIWITDEKDNLKKIKLSKKNFWIMKNFFFQTFQNIFFRIHISEFELQMTNKFCKTKIDIQKKNFFSVPLKNKKISKLLWNLIKS